MQYALCGKELQDLTKGDQSRDGELKDSRIVSSISCNGRIRPKGSPHLFGNIPSNENKDSDNAEDKIGDL